MKWLKKSGSDFEKTQIFRNKNSRNSIRAVKGVKKGEINVKIPTKIAISAQNLTQLNQNFEYEKNLDWQSDFHPYIKMMPEASFYPAFYSE